MLLSLARYVDVSLPLLYVYVYHQFTVAYSNRSGCPCRQPHRILHGSTVDDYHLNVHAV